MEKHDNSHKPHRAPTVSAVHRAVFFRHHRLKTMNFMWISRFRWQTSLTFRVFLHVACPWDDGRKMQNLGHPRPQTDVSSVWMCDFGGVCGFDLPKSSSYPRDIQRDKRRGTTRARAPLSRRRSRRDDNVKTADRYLVGIVFGCSHCRRRRRRMTNFGFSRSQWRHKKYLAHSLTSPVLWSRSRCRIIN